MIEGVVRGTLVDEGRKVGEAKGQLLFEGEQDF